MGKYDTLISAIKASYEIVIKEEETVASLQQLPRLQQLLTEQYYIERKPKRILAQTHNISLYRVALELNKAMRYLQNELNPAYRRWLTEAVSLARVR